MLLVRCVARYWHGCPLRQPSTSHEPGRVPPVRDATTRWLPRNGWEMWQTCCGQDIIGFWMSSGDKRLGPSCYFMICIFYASTSHPQKWVPFCSCQPLQLEVEQALFPSPSSVSLPHWLHCIKFRHLLPLAVFADLDANGWYTSPKSDSPFRIISHPGCLLLFPLFVASLFTIQQGSGRKFTFCGFLGLDLRQFKSGCPSELIISCNWQKFINLKTHQTLAESILIYFDKRQSTSFYLLFRSPGFLRSTGRDPQHSPVPPFLCPLLRHVAALRPATGVNDQGWDVHRRGLSLSIILFILRV